MYTFVLFDESSVWFGIALTTVLIAGIFGLIGCSPATTPPSHGSSDSTTVELSGSDHTDLSVGNQQSLDHSLDVIPAFIDVAAGCGIDFSFYSDTVPGRYFLPEIMGGGAAWSDLDNDGLLDLYLMNGSVLDSQNGQSQIHRNRLYRQTVDHAFRAAPDWCGAGDTGYGQGCAAGDFDADGFVDLYLANYGANILLKNNGDGTFSDFTTAARVEDNLWSSSVVWLDADGDDDLDLYVTNYLDVRLDNIQICEYSGRKGYCGPGQYESTPDRLFLNQGNGMFIESAAALGIIDEVGKGLAVAIVDFDGDLTPEIYVANDMAPNFLFTRDVDATDQCVYREVAKIAGCAQSGDGMNEASMGIACADFDGDSRIDLYLTHYYQMKNTLYRNLGDLLFDDVSRRTGVAESTYQYLGFGVVPLDIDRDGYDDLFIANGHVLGPENDPHRMRPQLIHNEMGQSFVDVASLAGDYFQHELLGRGAASADYDDDGDIDILVTHLDEPVALLNQATQPVGRFIGIDLRTEARIPPIGAQVRLSAGDRDLQKSWIAGGSYLCDSDQRLLFSLPESTQTVDVEISWPSGHVQTINGLEVDGYWRIWEGRPPIR